MKIDDNELKRLLQEGMEYEADLIMREVESDPNIKEAVAPEDLHVNLLKQIREREEAVEKEKAEQEKEEQELIRLGKKYKKKLSRRKYIILIAAVVCALAVGSVSFGDGEKVFSEMKRKLSDREQTVVNSGDEDTDFAKDIATEEEAYQKIEEEFGLWPVRMYYLPDGMDFEDAVVEEESQSARLYYADNQDKLISYYVTTNNREGSASTDVEEQLIKESEKEIGEVLAKIQEYLVEENETKRFRVLFEYNNAQYIITMTGIEEGEVEEIVEKLYFS